MFILIELNSPAFMTTDRGKSEPYMIKYSKGNNQEAALALTVYSHEVIYLFIFTVLSPAPTLTSEY